MKRKTFIVALLMVFSIFNMNNVFAKEVFYTNSNNVSFTEEEYEFLSTMFWDGCQELFSQNDYNKFINSNIINGIINTKTNNDIMPLSSLYENNNKYLKISTSCSSNCFVSVTLKWKNLPTIRSYDVMGAYLENTSLINSPITTISTNDTHLQSFNNGFGVSVKLPTDNSQIIVNQTFRVSTGGHVYASYQHAMSNISLNDSKKYTISKQGYGKVFKFSGTAVNVYDQMSGVDIAV